MLALVTLKLILGSKNEFLLRHFLQLNSTNNGKCFQFFFVKFEGLHFSVMKADGKGTLPKKFLITINYISKQTNK